MKTIKLDLTLLEKQQLKQKGVKISALAEYAADEIGALLNTDKKRASEIVALIAFQSIPSAGPKFARDLISLGYYAIHDLLDKDGPTLFNELEQKQGFWTDPCVEDQFGWQYIMPNIAAAIKTGGILHPKESCIAPNMVTQKKGP